MAVPSRAVLWAAPTTSTQVPPGGSLVATSPRSDAHVVPTRLLVSSLYQRDVAVRSITITEDLSDEEVVDFNGQPVPRWGANTWEPIAPKPVSPLLPGAQRIPGTILAIDLTPLLFTSWTSPLSVAGADLPTESSSDSLLLGFMPTVPRRGWVSFEIANTSGRMLAVDPSILVVGLEGVPVSFDAPLDRMGFGDSVVTLNSGVELLKSYLGAGLPAGIEALSPLLSAIVNPGDAMMQPANSSPMAAPVLQQIYAPPGARLRIFPPNRTFPLSQSGYVFVYLSQGALRTPLRGGGETGWVPTSAIHVTKIAQPTASIVRSPFRPASSPAASSVLARPALPLGGASSFLRHPAVSGWRGRRFW